MRDSATQAVGHNAHDLKRKPGVALNQRQKVGLADLGQQAIRAGDSGRHARLVVDQRHFTEDIAGAERFKPLSAHININLTFHHDVEGIATFTFPE